MNWRSHHWPDVAMLVAAVAVLGMVFFLFKDWPPEPPHSALPAAGAEPTPTPAEQPSSTPTTRTGTIAVLSDSPDTGAWLRGTVEAGRVDGYQVGRVATRSGADTEAIHALVPRAADADWVVVQAGTNDLLGGDTPRQAVSGVKSLVSDVRAEGPSVIVALVPPSDERPTRVQQVNNRLQRWASQKGIGVLDVYSPVADSDGSYRAGLSDDGVRANAAGGRLEARAVARQLPDLLG